MLSIVLFLFLYYKGAVCCFFFFSFIWKRKTNGVITKVHSLCTIKILFFTRKNCCFCFCWLWNNCMFALIKLTKQGCRGAVQNLFATKIMLAMSKYSVGYYSGIVIWKNSNNNSDCAIFWSTIRQCRFYVLTANRKLKLWRKFIKRGWCETIVNVLMDKSCVIQRLQQ